MRCANRWDDLPSELRDLVLSHRAAQTIQASLSHRFRFRHARRREWGSVRVRLGGWAVRELWPYPLVRREWRTEPSSWCHTDASYVRLLIDETRYGLWGTPSARLICLCSESDEECGLCRPPSP